LNDLFQFKHRELDAAKRKAAASLQELSQLRQSLDSSMRESTARRVTHSRTPSTASIPEHDVLDVSMAQVDELLLQFQDSLHGLGTTAAVTPGGGLNASRKSHAASSTGGSTGFSHSNNDSPQLGLDGTGMSGLDVNAFLERYSDKLADMVGDKLLSRMSSTKS
jgi:hypothetical protein